MGFVRRHLFNGNDRAAKLVVKLHHLRQNTVSPFGADTEVVCQNHRKRVVAHQIAAGEYGVAQTLHFILTGKGETVVIDQITDGCQQILLARSCNLVLKLIADVEMILDSPLASPGYEAELVNAGLGGFLNAILNQGFIHHREDFLGHCLGCREEAGTVAGYGKQALLDHNACPYICLGHRLLPVGCP